MTIFYYALLLLLLVVIIAICYSVIRNSKHHTEIINYSIEGGERHKHAWGFIDTKFVFDDPRTVFVTGSRYPLAGYSMPYFIDFVEDVLGVEIDSRAMLKPREMNQTESARYDKSFLFQLKEFLSEEQISLDPRIRIEHSHGQLSVDEVYRLLYVEPYKRIADIVVFPENQKQICSLIDAAQKSNVCLIPYGGGTNVTGALICRSDENRTIVSVDMKRLNRVLWIDEENLTACAESGITGKELELELNSHGYTCGHEPDSIEFSTLGGWISTNASGMRRGRYGNIEDIVLDIEIITPVGDIGGSSYLPRVSAGSRIQSIIFGSEGNLGIIISAVIKIHPVPKTRQYASLVFPTYSSGVAFLRAVNDCGSLPASVRLVNNAEFRFGQALRAKCSAFEGLFRLAQHFYLFRCLRFNPDTIAACTIAMEGSAREVRHERRNLLKIARRSGGLSGGSSNGQRGFALTFSIAYIRDFLNQLSVLGETLETSVGWNRIESLYNAVEQKLHELCKVNRIQGHPYLGVRITQIYNTGVCLYFTVGFSAFGLDKPHIIFSKIERELRCTIISSGGSISHHHGVGKLRRDFVNEAHSPVAITALSALKQSVDPKNIFAASNGPF